MCQRYWLNLPGPAVFRPVLSEWLTRQPGGATRNSASCRIFLVYRIAVELAEQGIAVFFGPVGQMGDEGFDLLTGCFAEGLGPAEVDRVELDEVGIQNSQSQGAVVIQVQWLALLASAGVVCQH